MERGRRRAPSGARGKNETRSSSGKVVPAKTENSVGRSTPATSGSGNHVDVLRGLDVRVDQKPAQKRPAAQLSAEKEAAEALCWPRIRHAYGFADRITVSARTRGPLGPPQLPDGPLRQAEKNLMEINGKDAIESTNSSAAPLPAPVPASCRSFSYIPQRFKLPLRWYCCSLSLRKTRMYLLTLPWCS